MNAPNTLRYSFGPAVLAAALAMRRRYLNAPLDLQPRRGNHPGWTRAQQWNLEAEQLCHTFGLGLQDYYALMRTLR